MARSGLDGPERVDMHIYILVVRSLLESIVVCQIQYVTSFQTCKKLEQPCR